MVNDKKVCITGGAGFIGSFLTRALLDKGYKVVIFDKYQPSASGLDFIQGNILDAEAVSHAFTGCNFVFHLASPVGVEETEAAGFSVFDAIMAGTKNVLNGCRLNGVEKLFFSSSSEVYGEVREGKAEEDNIQHLRRQKSDYGRAKLASENLIKEMAKNSGPRFIISRFFNVYGPGQRLAFVMAKFVKAACRNESIYIYGDGRQIRTFCYVEDAVKGVISAFEKADNEVFNIGNDSEPVTMKELAEKIKTLAGSKSVIKFVSMDKSDRSAEREIYRRVPSVEKARRILNYEPQVSLNNGIMKKINYIRQIV